MLDLEEGTASCAVNTETEKPVGTCQSKHRRACAAAVVLHMLDVSDLCCCAWWASLQVTAKIKLLDNYGASRRWRNRNRRCCTCWT